MARREDSARERKTQEAKMFHESVVIRPRGIYKLALIPDAIMHRAYMAATQSTLTGGYTIPTIASKVTSFTWASLVISIHI